MKFYRNISKLHKTQIHVGPSMHPKSQILFGVWCAWLSNSLSFFQTGEKTQNIHWFPVNETGHTQLRGFSFWWHCSVFCFEDKFGIQSLKSFYKITIIIILIIILLFNNVIVHYVLFWTVFELVSTQCSTAHSRPRST